MRKTFEPETLNIEHFSANSKWRKANGGLKKKEYVSQAWERKGTDLLIGILSKSAEK